MYRHIISEWLARLGRPELDPRFVEAWIRIQYPTLDHLSRDEFGREVRTAIECIDLASHDDTAALADSFGLVM